VAQRQRFLVEIEAGSDTLEGFVGPAHGDSEGANSAVPFSGYLELIAELERARETSRDARSVRGEGPAAQPGPSP
jgi:hypothetical protein